MLTDNRTASQLASHAQRAVAHADCANVSIEHRDGYCIAWRLLVPRGRTGWAESYADHNGDRRKAEVAARFRCARYREED